MMFKSISEIKTEIVTESVQTQTQAQISQILEKQTRDGKPFLEVQLVDASGNMTLRVWSDHPDFRKIQDLGNKAFIALSGEFLNSQYGVETRNWNIRVLTEEEIESLLVGGGPKKELQEEYFQKILSFIETIQDPRLQKLLDLFLEKHSKAFKRAAAARKFHHSRRGGLVEHVALMMRSAHAICEIYPELNRDLLLAGTFFHDIGKLWETCPPEHGFDLPFQEIGELLGHISIGMQVVQSLWIEMLNSDTENEWKDLEPDSNSVKLHLLHLIASHHGELEFGSPVHPKTPEAQALHYIDNLDAKMEMFRQGYTQGKRITQTLVERPKPLPSNIVEPLMKFSSPFPIEEQKQEESTDVASSHPDFEVLHEKEEGLEEENTPDEVFDVFSSFLDQKVSKKEKRQKKEQNENLDFGF